MQVKIRFFAAHKDIVGQSEMDLTLEESITGNELEKLLGEQYPKLSGKLPYCRLAVNMEFVDKGSAINHEDEIAFIPPVSGG